MCSSQRLVTLIGKQPRPLKEHCGEAARCLSSAGYVIKTVSVYKYSTNSSVALLPPGHQAITHQEAGDRDARNKMDEYLKQAIISHKIFLVSVIKYLIK